MMTFTEQVELAQEITGFSDAVSTAKYKRDINFGGSRFQALLGRSFIRKQQIADIVATQQYYKFSKSVLRPKEVIFDDGSQETPLEFVASEHQWNYMNQTPASGNPSHFFIRGNQEIGLYPTPAAAYTGGLKVAFEPRQLKLAVDDFTDGSVTVNEGSRTITHSGTGFNSDMVGRFFGVSDGSDGRYYQITAFVSSSQLTLENYYEGFSGGGKSFRIGQMMDIPDEYHEAPVDYAMHRWWLKKGDSTKARDFKTLFEESLMLAKTEYARKTSSRIINVKRTRPYNPLTDTPNSIPT